MVPSRAQSSTRTAKCVRITLTILIAAGSALQAQVVLPLSRTELRDEAITRDSISSLERRIRRRATELRAEAAAKRDSLTRLPSRAGVDAAQSRLLEARLEREVQQLEDRAAGKDRNAARMNRFVGFYRRHIDLFPVSPFDTEAARCFWTPDRQGDGLALLPGVSLSAGQSRGSLAVEAAADFFYGFRSYLSSTVAASKDNNDILENAQRFLNGGGNAVLGVQWPILEVASELSKCKVSQAEISARAAMLEELREEAGEDKPEPSTVRKASQFSFLIALSPRLGVDIPELGTPKQEVDYSLDVGLQGRTMLSGADGGLGILAEGRLGVVPVASREFYNGIGRSLDEAGNSRGAFAYMRLTLGLRVRDNVMLTYSLPVFAPSELKENFKGFLSVNLVRANPKKEKLEETGPLSAPASKTGEQQEPDREEAGAANSGAGGVPGTPPMEK
jgi:hypothetical protein